MRNFQDTFKTPQRSFMSVFAVCMTVPLSAKINETIQIDAAI